MWCLRSVRDADVVYYLPVGASYTIGRKDSDIVIPDDFSVSRNHAVIIVKSDDVVSIEDKSKFGTEVNDVKITSCKSLNHNDKIRFGQGTSTFKLIHHQLTFCHSNMSVREKEIINNLIQKLDGKLESTWSPSCTHLVMSAVIITVKVVNALASCCPIVTISWLQECVICLNKKNVFPSTSSYVPSITDDNLKDKLQGSPLKPVFSRRKLFHMKNFYFFDQNQYTSLRYCLKAAGAKTFHFTEVSQMTKELVADKSTIIISPTKVSLQDELIKHTNKSDVRLISESEIGLAILHCSDNYYCNPHIPLNNSQALSVPPSANTQDASILAYDTFHATSTQRHNEDVKPSYNEGILGSVDRSIIPSSVCTPIKSSIQQSILAPDTFPLSQMSFNSPVSFSAQKDIKPVASNSLTEQVNTSLIKFNNTIQHQSQTNGRESVNTPVNMMDYMHHAVSTTRPSTFSSQGSLKSTPIKQVKLENQPNLDDDEPIISDEADGGPTISDGTSDGYITSHANPIKSQLADETPLGYAVVVKADLVKKRRRNELNSNSHDLSIPNFKKFKKVRHPNVDYDNRVILTTDDFLSYT